MLSLPTENKVFSPAKEDRANSLLDDSQESRLVACLTRTNLKFDQRLPERRWFSTSSVESKKYPRLLNSCQLPLFVGFCFPSTPPLLNLPRTPPLIKFCPLSLLSFLNFQLCLGRLFSSWFSSRWLVAAKLTSQLPWKHEDCPVRDLGSPF